MVALYKKDDRIEFRFGGNTVLDRGLIKSVDVTPLGVIYTVKLDTFRKLASIRHTCVVRQIDKDLTDRFPGLDIEAAIEQVEFQKEEARKLRSRLTDDAPKRRATEEEMKQ